MKLMVMVTLTLFFISLVSVVWAVNETDTTLNLTNQSNFSGIYEEGNYSGLVYTIRGIETEIYTEEVNCSTENNTNCTYNRTINQTTTHVYLQEPRHNVSLELNDYETFNESAWLLSQANGTNLSNTTQILTIKEEQEVATTMELVGDEHKFTRESLYGPVLLVVALILAVFYVRRDARRQREKLTNISFKHQEKKVAESKQPFSCSHLTPESRALALREKGYPSSFIEKKYKEWKHDAEEKIR